MKAIGILGVAILCLMVTCTFLQSAFPLAEGKSSYAYELDCSNDEHLVNFIDQFCAILDIQLGPFQLTLNSTRY